jgi:hypothetical protein
MRSRSSASRDRSAPVTRARGRGRAYRSDFEEPWKRYLPVALEKAATRATVATRVRGNVAAVAGVAPSREEGKGDVEIYFLAETMADAPNARYSMLISEKLFAFRASINSSIHLVSFRQMGSSWNAIPHSGCFHFP